MCVCAKDAEGAPRGSSRPLCCPRCSALRKPQPTQLPSDCNWQRPHFNSPHNTLHDDHLHYSPQHHTTGARRSPLVVVRMEGGSPRSVWSLDGRSVHTCPRGHANSHSSSDHSVPSPESILNHMYTPSHQRDPPGSRRHRDPHAKTPIAPIGPRASIPPERASGSSACCRATPRTDNGHRQRTCGGMGMRAQEKVHTWIQWRGGTGVGGHRICLETA
jgi:hypothetical protein